MNFVLIDDLNAWQALLPLTYTRPISELVVGIQTISKKWQTILQSPVSYSSQDYLSAKFSLTIAEDNILINSQLLPDDIIVSMIMDLSINEVIYNQDGVFIATRVNSNTLTEIDKSGSLNSLSNAIRIEKDVSIRMIQKPYDIFSYNGAEIIHDYDQITQDKTTAELNNSNRHIGSHPIFISSGAQISCCNFNTTNGPIFIGKNVTIMEGCNIQGPFSIDDESTIKMGAKIYKDTSIGKNCKVGGELNNVVMFDNSNKGHDGYLGNAVIGEWCNLGADTNNSNLKNNYSEVKLWSYVRPGFDKTGLQFCGLIMGDHTKCGINVMFNTGTVVGIFANIFGAGYQKNFIPSFSWGGPKDYTTYQLKKTFEVAEIVMARRNVQFTAVDKKILEDIFDLSQTYRK